MAGSLPLEREDQLASQEIVRVMCPVSLCARACRIRSVCNAQPPVSDT